MIDRSLLACAAVLLSASGLLQADTHIQRTHHTDACTTRGNPVSDVNHTSAIWLGKDRARIDLSSDSSIIIRLDNNMIYLLRHKVKTYVRELIDPSKGVMYTAIEDDGDMTVVEKPLPAATMKVSLSGAGEKSRKKIRGWNCRRYNVIYSVNGVSARSTLWVTRDVKIDYALYNMITNVYLKKMAGITDVCKEIDKIKGFPVLVTTKTQVMGTTVKSSEEIIEITEKAPPRDAYTIPTGYIRTGK